LLAREVGTASEFYNLESHSSLLDVVYMAGAQCTNLGCEQNVAELKLLFLRTLFDWMSATGLFCFSNLLEFLDSCCF
jgi:hypothetical protein